jgi:FkbM family methyltransferase
VSRAPRRLPRALVRPGVPWRTRWSLLTTALRRRVAPEPVYTVRFGRGRLPLSHDDYAVDWETLKTIVVDRVYELDYHGAVVLDIGAHKGYFGAFALERGARTVVSFEPESTNFAFLERCSAPYRARALDWRLRQEAVSGAAGEAELHVMGASWGHALSPPDEWAQYEVGVERVPLVALADVLAEAAADTPAGARLIVKINAEGAECPMVLESPPDSWARVSDVLIETHAWAPCTAAELARHLSDAGLRRLPGEEGGWVLRMARP